MIGDAAHKRLLDDGWTWNGCEVYTKILGKGRWPGKVSSCAVNAVQALKTSRKVSSSLELTRGIYTS